MLSPACLSNLLIILNLISSPPPSLTPSLSFSFRAVQSPPPSRLCRVTMLGFPALRIHSPDFTAANLPRDEAQPFCMAFLVCTSSSLPCPQLLSHNMDLQVFLSQDTVPLPVYPLFRYVQSGLRITFLH